MYIWRKKNQIEYVQMKSTSNVLFNPTARHSGHHWRGKGRRKARKNSEID